jgi:hypothetical protein
MREQAMSRKFQMLGFAGLGTTEERGTVTIPAATNVALTAGTELVVPDETAYVLARGAIVKLVLATTATMSSEAPSLRSLDRATTIALLTEETMTEPSALGWPSSFGPGTQFALRSGTVVEVGLVAPPPPPGDDLPPPDGDQPPVPPATTSWKPWKLIVCAAAGVGTLVLAGLLAVRSRRRR